MGDNEDRRTLEARFDGARLTAIQATDDSLGLRARGLATEHTAEVREQARKRTQEAMHDLEPIPGVPPPELHQDRAANRPT